MRILLLILVFMSSLCFSQTSSTLSDMPQRVQKIDNTAKLTQKEKTLSFFVSHTNKLDDGAGHMIGDYSNEYVSEPQKLHSWMIGHDFRNHPVSCSLEISSGDRYIGYVEKGFYVSLKKPVTINIQSPLISEKNTRSIGSQIFNILKKNKIEVWKNGIFCEIDRNESGESEGFAYRIVPIQTNFQKRSTLNKFIAIATINESSSGEIMVQPIKLSSEDQQDVTLALDSSGSSMYVEIKWEDFELFENEEVLSINITHKEAPLIFSSIGKNLNGRIKKEKEGFILEYEKIKRKGSIRGIYPAVR